MFLDVIKASNTTEQSLDGFCVPTCGLQELSDVVVVRL